MIEPIGIIEPITFSTIAMAVASGVAATGVAATKSVTKWWRRWRACQPAPQTGLAGKPLRFLPPAREMPEGAIFVSYAHEDLAAAKRMKTGLDVAGITVWNERIFVTLFPLFSAVPLGSLRFGGRFRGYGEEL